MPWHPNHLTIKVKAAISKIAKVRIQSPWTQNTQHTGWNGWTEARQTKPHARHNIAKHDLNDLELPCHYK